MAYYTVRMNLLNAAFPLLTELWGQSIIVPQYDQNYDRQIISATDSDRDKGVPQAFYMHNVVPTSNGYQSIAYDEFAPPFGDGTSQDFDEAFPIQTVDLAKVVWVPAAGKNYIYSGTSKSWASVNPIAPGVLADDVLVTTAYLHAETYMFYAKYGCFKYTTSTATIDPVTLTSLNLPDILGICAANGYMIAWTAIGVSWSSLIDPTDFTPSLTTGAGGGQINEAKGAVICCLPIAGGFLVYCERNIVAAKYMGNVQFPFVFAEVPGSSSVQSPEQVSWQSNLGSHYAWTDIGLIELDKNGIRNLYADVTDFIAARVFEDFDESSLTLIREPLLASMNIKISIIGSRFMIMSYGTVPNNYTHALFYDITMKRWGKLKIPHRDVFQWNQPSLIGPITYSQLEGRSYNDLQGTTYGAFAGVINAAPDIKSNIAFLQADGTVKVVNFNYQETNASGVLITGKYQFFRNNWTIHLATKLETVRQGNTLAFYIYASKDGKTLNPAHPMLIKTVNSPEVQEFAGKVTAQSFALAFIGAFNINSLELTLMRGGNR